MTRSFRSIHDEQIFQWIAEFSCQLINTCFEASIFQWFVCVENWHDDDWDDRHHEDRKAKRKGPKINIEVFSTHLNAIDDPLKAMSYVPAITVEMGKHDVGKRKEERVRMGEKGENVESKIYTVTNVFNLPL